MGITSGHLVPAANEHTPGRTAPLVVDDQTAKVIDALFKAMRAIFPAWRQAWPTNAYLMAAKQEWTQAFMDAGINTIEQLEIGLAACRTRKGDFAPSPGTFIALCKPQPEKLGLPPVGMAYLEAVRCSHPYGDAQWSHAAIYFAAREVGFFALQHHGQQETRPRFEEAYARACQLIVMGDQLPDPPKAKGLPEPKPVPNKAIAAEALRNIRARIKGGSHD